MNPDPQTDRKAEAIRWAKAGAILNPGIMFTAIVGDRMWSYETKPTDPTERLREMK